MTIKKYQHFSNKNEYFRVKFTEEEKLKMKINFDNIKKYSGEFLEYEEIKLIRENEYLFIFKTKFSKSLKFCISLKIKENKISIGDSFFFRDIYISKRYTNYKFLVDLDKLLSVLLEL